MVRLLICHQTLQGLLIAASFWHTETVPLISLAAGGVPLQASCVSRGQGLHLTLPGIQAGRQMGCVDSISRPIFAAEEMMESAQVLKYARMQLLSVCWAGTVVAGTAMQKQQQHTELHGQVAGCFLGASDVALPLNHTYGVSWSDCTMIFVCSSQQVQSRRGLGGCGNQGACAWMWEARSCAGGCTIA